MVKIVLRLLIVVFAFQTGKTWAQEESNTEESVNQEELLLAFQKYRDSIDKTFNYQTGEVSLDNGLALLKVPVGYRFLDKKQAE